MKPWRLWLALIALPASLHASSGGPFADRNKLCGTNPGCNSCHSLGTALPSMATLDFKLTGPPEAPLPATYTPATSYRLLLRIVENNPNRCAGGACIFGFQVAATSTCGAAPRQAGCFTAAADQQFRCGGTGAGGCEPGCAFMDFLEHTFASSAPDPATSNTRTWIFDWMAPAAGTGPVTFYYAANSGDNNGFRTGDVPYFGSATLTEAVPGCDLVKGSIASLTPPPDQTAKETLLFGDASSCAPARIPGNLAIAGYTQSPVQALAAPISTGDALIVYQVKCPCGGRLFVTRSAANLDQMTATFQ